MTDTAPALSAEEFASLIEVSKGEAQREISQLDWVRLVGLGYAVRRLGESGPDRVRFATGTTITAVLDPTQRFTDCVDPHVGFGSGRQNQF